jgi:hypothetical protein
MKKETYETEMTSGTIKEYLPWLVSLQNRTADTGSFHKAEK